jgi:polygalacturonase
MKLRVTWNIFGKIHFQKGHLPKRVGQRFSVGMTVTRNSSREGVVECTIPDASGLRVFSRPFGTVTRSASAPNLERLGNCRFIPSGWYFLSAILAISLLTGFCLNAAEKSQNPWSQLPSIVTALKAPSFPNRYFAITKFGAIEGGTNDCTEAMHKAIEACHEAGGGHVMIPPGTFLTGPIHLLSGVDLHLQKGATLLFQTNPAAYLPAVFTRFEGMECWNYSPLIYAFEQHDIAVTGEGTLDGQASNENWWAWKGRRQASSKGNQKKARDRLIKMVENNTPPEERRFGEGDFLRPSFVEPNRCRNVLIQGIKIRGSPMWELHPLLCTNVIVRGVEIDSHGPNNDGCDPECSRDVLIENCTFDTGDDCIAIKSGRNNDGRRVGLPSENLIIRGCTMRDGHGGVTIGSEISGGCRNVFVENCRMDSPSLERVLRFKSNAVRGGVVENIFMRNVQVGRVADAVLQIDFMYEEGPNGPHKPVVRNVLMEKVTVTNTPRVLNVTGFSEAEISHVRLADSTFKRVKKPDVLEKADVKLVNCKVEEAP